MGKNTKSPVKLVLLVALVLATAGLFAACGNSETADVGDANEVVLDSDTHDDEDVHEDAVVGDDAHDDGDTHAVAVVEGDAHDDGDAHEAAAMDGDAHDDGDEEFVEIIINVVEDGSDWHFEPAVIDVVAGQRTKLTLVNTGRSEHDLEIASLAVENVEVLGGAEHEEALSGGHHMEAVVAAHAMAGTSASVMFTPLAVGEFDFACTITGHRALGMEGKVVVTTELARGS